MGLLSRLFGDRRDRSDLMLLYNAVVAEARRPDWYQRGLVPDTHDLCKALVEAVAARGG